MKNEFTSKFLKNTLVDCCRQAAELLGNAFLWEASPQGHDAWAAVYAALHQIADAAEKEAK